MSEEDFWKSKNINKSFVKQFQIMPDDIQRYIAKFAYISLMKEYFQQWKYRNNKVITELNKKIPNIYYEKKCEKCQILINEYDPSSNNIALFCENCLPIKYNNSIGNIYSREFQNIDQYRYLEINNP